MKFFAVLLLASSAFAASSGGHGLEKRRLDTRAAALFASLSIAAGNISGGKTGNAAAEAAKVCVTPFAGTCLSAVSAADLANLNTFAKAAVAAEAKFNTAIAAASGAAKTALSNGKIKNKVLKLTCEVQVLKIQQAQGKNTAAAVATEGAKLTKDTAIDVGNPGQASTAAPGL